MLATAGSNRAVHHCQWEWKTKDDWAPAVFRHSKILSIAAPRLIRSLDPELKSVYQSKSDINIHNFKTVGLERLSRPRSVPRRRGS